MKKKCFTICYEFSKYVICSFECYFVDYFASQSKYPDLGMLYFTFNIQFCSNKSNKELSNCFIAQKKCHNVCYNAMFWNKYVLCYISIAFFAIAISVAKVKLKLL